MYPRIARPIGFVALIATSLVMVRPATAQAPREAVDVLFIGNSYIYFNNLPRLVEAIAESLEGPVIRSGSHTHGGFTLRRHLADGHVPAVLDGSPADGSWERVVIQEQSSLGAPLADPEAGVLGDPERFHDATRDFVPLIERTGAVPVLYMTWAKERFPQQTGDLARAYDGIGEELEIAVAPVGLAWARVRGERPELDLFLPDGSHPNGTGSYLAACVFYAQLTGQSPEGAAAEITGPPWDNSQILSTEASTTLVSVPADIARYLQRVAWETVASRE